LLCFACTCRWDNVGQAAGILLGELLPDRWRLFSREARFVSVDWARGDSKTITYQQGLPIVDKVRLMCEGATACMS